MRGGDAVVFAAALVACVFAFGLLSPEATLASQWSVYVNPFNSFVLYAAGVALYFHCQTWRPTVGLRIAMIVGPLIVFALHPATGNQISLVTGANRVVFVAISVAIVLGFYVAVPPLPKAISWPLERLGTISYGVYLLHPFAIGVVGKLPGISAAQPLVFVACVAVITLVGATVVYLTIERPLQRLGKRVALRMVAGHVPVGR